MTAVKFFKATGIEGQAPSYFAAYSKKDARLYDYNAKNPQLLEFTEVTFDDIPVFDNITCAGLEFMDARNVIKQIVNRRKVWQALTTLNTD